MAFRNSEHSRNEPSPITPLTQRPRSACGILQTRDDVYARVIEKLRREPIEDLRLDFEDELRQSPDEEEDATCDSAAAEVAKDSPRHLPPFIGIRIKSLTENQGPQPANSRPISSCLSTIPAPAARNSSSAARNHRPEQVRRAHEALDKFGELRMEMMIETPQSAVMLPGMLENRRVAASPRISEPTITPRARHHTPRNEHMLHPLAIRGSRCRHTRKARVFALRRCHQHHAVPMSSRRNLILPSKRKSRASIVLRNSPHHIPPFARQRVLSRAGTCIPRNCHRASPRSTRSSLDRMNRRQIDCKFHQQGRAGDHGGRCFDDAATGQGLLNYFLRPSL